MRNNEDLLKLFDRIYNGVATDDDIREYNRWCRGFQESRGFQEKDLPLADLEKIKAGMLAEIEKQISSSHKISRPKVWRRITAAASIILVLAIGSYYFMHRQHSDPEQMVQATPPDVDVTPGGNKAMLTLANGQTIVLDNIQPGQLASQGSSRVTKADSGVLVYQSEKLTIKGVTQEAQAPVTFNTLTIPRGGQYQLILPDGTKVWLNSASSIRFPTAFTGKERSVAITGEVYMEVAKDTAHPFIVTARHTNITVLGTRFNVMAYDNEPAVNATLLEGSVQVTVPGTRAATVISPGQQASVDNTSRDITIRKVNAANIAAWIYGQLSLKDCSLQEFMNQLSRWYNVDVEYTGKVPSQRFGGMIDRNAPLSDVLSALDVGGIHTKLENNKIIVLSH